MSERVGFVTMGEAGQQSGEVPTLGVGMLGYAFMGKAHTNAYKTLEYSVWWPQGHIIGWEHTFVHEIAHFFACIVSGRSVAPEGADFEDGYRASVAADAILESARTGRRVDIAL